MPLSLYEIVELADGKVGLQKAGETGEPLVTIAFSEEAISYVQDAKLEIVKAMIEAGLEAAADIAEEQTPSVDAELEAEDQSPRVLH